MEEYKRLFLEKAKEHRFSIPGLRIIVSSPENEAKVIEWLSTEKGSSEAARYCLVNGLIPFTKENVALVTKTRDSTWGFFIRRQRIPAEMRQRLLDMALKTDRDKWELDEEDQHEHELISTKLEGIHIANGRVTLVSVEEKLKVILRRTLYTPLIDEPVFEE